MCLLIARFGVEPGLPLVVGANRDERYERPATAVTVLRHRPRVLGGRDELAGGTWLAVNEHGVVAGLTNRPSSNGRDPSKRSRGELPLALAAHVEAAAGVDEVCSTVRPGDYNPCWVLVGDRRHLFYLELPEGGGSPVVTELGPGTYVVENSALGSPTPKATHVAARLAGGPRGNGPFDVLASVLRDHTVPEGAAQGSPPAAGGSGDGAPRPPQLAAACVHTDSYGTRSSLLAAVAAGAGRPVLYVADGPPCRAPFVAADPLWEA